MWRYLIKVMNTIAAVSLQPHPAPNAAAAGGVSDSCTSHAHASRIRARTDRGSLRIFTTREEEVETWGARVT